MNYLIFDLGQSNGDGRAEVKRMTSTVGYLRNPGAAIYYKSTQDIATDGAFQKINLGTNNIDPQHLPDNDWFGAEGSLIPNIKNQVKNLYYVKCDRGSTSLASVAGTDWNENNANEMYDIATQGYLDKALSLIPNTTNLKVVILWFQGETDAAQGNASVYKQNFENMITSLRAHNSLLANAPLIITKLDFAQSAGETTVNDELQSYVDENENAYIVDISDHPRKSDLTTEQKLGVSPSPGSSDDAHQSYIQQVARGERIYNILAGIYGWDQITESF